MLLCWLLVAGCRPADSPEPEAPRPSPAAPAPRPAATLYPAEIEPGIALEVRRTGSRRYAMRGATARTHRLRLEVEDGHHVLFGPVEIPVEDGRFRIEFVAEPTDRDHIFFYITDADGDRLAVVPVDTARESTTAGPALEPPPAEAGPAEPAVPPVDD